MRYPRQEKDEQEIKRVEEECSRILEGFRRQGMQFKSATSVAKQLAPHVGRHFTNLMKNPAYRKVIEDWRLAQSGNAENVPDELASAPVLMAKLRTARIEISNLKAHIKALEAQASKSQPKTIVVADAYTPTKAEVEFSVTCDVLHDLIERLGADTIERNYESGLLIDKFPTNGKSEVIGGDSKAKPYLRWCQERVASGKLISGGE